MDVVVDTSLEIEASRLPELLYVAALMVNVENELWEVANQKQSEVVCLEASIESLEVRAKLLVALIAEDLQNIV